MHTYIHTYIHAYMLPFQSVFFSGGVFFTDTREFTKGV